MSGPLPGLPSLNRFITTHNAEGKATFSKAIDEVTPLKPVAVGDAVFGLHYCSEQFPANLNQDIDIDTYKKYMDQAPGLVISSGTVLRTVDMHPGAISPMHRTVSLDYGVVLEGEVELVLDSGETRPMKRGDVAIQRGTMHAWRNMSNTEPARMLYVLQPCQPLTVGGERLGEDLETMEGVRSST
ncbi:hypothetical protein BAUCODRAFT_340531 [Baudoinia panamericana UAMH 10762]|uniref:Cupin type-2 domain-containing protein n=1 Tax=Baudoinia panamericana (strain UAMH 10762) TaxID=717646 RepID=M2N661_BAUPA|nr:uncharacterized protein BAUCODRAFT_340531 [Baudoinia panamericana UAMH 10762]EMC99528.1 hypothetical protein BAUCODRAFT_340531 [Baudoinia panamericana UAMH 10762]